MAVLVVAAEVTGVVSVAVVVVVVVAVVVAVLMAAAARRRQRQRQQQWWWWWRRFRIHWRCIEWYNYSRKCIYARSRWWNYDWS
jgi:uncharacterized membrane protein